MKTMLTMIAVTLVFADYAQGALPETIKRQVKLLSIDGFLDFMKAESEFYRITNLHVEDSKFESGQETVRATLKFEDSKACRDRQYVTECADLGDALFCIKTGTDCKGEKIFSRTQSIKP
jgi:hypothetical protein